MPNNLIFNDVAGALKTQIYGSDTTTAINTDASGNLSIIGNVTATITSTVPIEGNVTATITSTVPIEGNVTATITSSVPVEGNVTVANTVTVTITSTVPIEGNVTATITSTVPIEGNVTATITSTVTVTGLATKSGNAFTSDNVTITSAGALSTATFSKDTSQQSVYSFYVRNAGTADVSMKLQIAPIDNDNYYWDDPSGAVTVTAGSNYTFVAQRYLQYTRINATSAAAATIEVYYNAHV